jgi:hypothetical protein
MLVEGVVIVELKSSNASIPSTWHRASHI